MNWQRLKYNVVSGIKRFLYGRNGLDQLTIAILITSFILYFIAQLTRLPLLLIIYYAGILIGLYRIFSKNIFKRRKENDYFLSKTRAVSASFRIYQNIFRERKTYKYFKCPECKQYLKVPKGKGKIDITCAKCGRHMIKTV